MIYNHRNKGNSIELLSYSWRLELKLCEVWGAAIGTLALQVVHCIAFVESYTSRNAHCIEIATHTASLSIADMNLDSRFVMVLAISCICHVMKRHRKWLQVIFTSFRRGIALRVAWVCMLDTFPLLSFTSAKVATPTASILFTEKRGMDRHIWSVTGQFKHKHAFDKWNNLCFSPLHAITSCTRNLISYKYIS